MDNRLNGKRLPGSIDEVDPSALNLLVDHQFGFVAGLMESQASEVEELMRSEVGANAVKAALAEYMATARIRLMLLSTQAMTTLDEVMQDEKEDSKTATARVRAAEAILDRAGFPKALQQFRVNADLQESDRILPSMEDVLKNVPPEDVPSVMAKFREASVMIDELRAGGMIVDGEKMDSDSEKGSPQ